MTDDIDDIITDANEVLDVAEEFGALERRNVTLAAALRAAQAGCGGFLWLGNNIHNWDTEKFRELFIRALGDAREGYNAAVDALGEGTKQ